MFVLLLQDIVARLYSNPKRIFNLPDQDCTYIEVDMDEEWTIPDETKYCRSKWTPFSGRRVRGCVCKVVLRGEVAYIDGKVIIITSHYCLAKYWSFCLGAQ